MVSFPYPKLCTANMQVDQGAGYIVCSAEAARAAGVPEDRWVFPLSGADANDHWFISHRPELHRSPAIRLAGAAALELAGVGIDDVAAIDLYSCFPVVVQMAAAELGLSVDDPARPLTLTGGLTFGGGPGNNYTSHGIARGGRRAAGRARGARRSSPASGGTPRSTPSGSTRRAPRPTAAPAPSPGATSSPRSTHCPQCRVDAEATGPVRVETYTVTFDRDGAPERGILACRTGDGSRAWGNVDDPDALALLCAEEGIGRTGVLAAAGLCRSTGRRPPGAENLMVR